MYKKSVEVSLILKTNWFFFCFLFLTFLLPSAWLDVKVPSNIFNAHSAPFHLLKMHDLQFVPNVRKIRGLNNAKIVKELTYLNLKIKRQCAIKRAVKLNMIKCFYREISMPTIQITLHVEAASYEYVLIKYRIGFLVDEVR